MCLPTSCCRDTWGRLVAPHTSRQVRPACVAVCWGLTACWCWLAACCRNQFWGLTSHLPHSTQVWMYCVGNHEIELTDGVKDFLSYTTR